MVAIKIQSLEDIIKAYLQNLGFGGEGLENGVALVVTRLGDKFEPDNVLKSLDEIVGATAGRIIRDKRLDKEQKLAAFKLSFMLCGGSDKWGVPLLLGDEIDESAKKELQQHILNVVPEYQFSGMAPQPIESLMTGSLCQQLWNRKKA